MKLLIDISKDRYDEIMAMDWVNGRRFFDEELRAIHDGIPQMAERWIPVSERLPEVGQRVIATVESIDGNYVRETICGKYGLLCGNGIAWMPLPTPLNKPEIKTGAESEE